MPFHSEQLSKCFPIFGNFNCHLSENQLVELKAFRNKNQCPPSECGNSLSGRERAECKAVQIIETGPWSYTHEGRCEVSVRNKHCLFQCWVANSLLQNTEHCVSHSTHWQQILLLVILDCYKNVIFPMINLSMSIIFY